MNNRFVAFFEKQFERQVREREFALNPFELLALEHLRVIAEKPCANLESWIGRSLAIVAKIRTLLFAMLLSLVAMPDGITVCLRQLGGGASERGCCATCCTRKTGERGQPAVTAGPCARCCLSVPARETKLDVVPKNPTHSGFAPLLAFVFTSVDPGPAHSRLAARPELGRPRLPVPIAPPLRI